MAAAPTVPPRLTVLPLPVMVSVSAVMPERSITRLLAVISMFAALPEKVTAPPSPAITSVLTLTESPRVMFALSAGSAARTDIPAWPSAVRVTLSQPLSTTRFGVETSERFTVCTGAEKIRSPVRLDAVRVVSPETMLPPGRAGVLRGDIARDTGDHGDKFRTGQLFIRCEGSRGVALDNAGRNESRRRLLLRGGHGAGVGEHAQLVRAGLCAVIDEGSHDIDEGFRTGRGVRELRLSAASMRFR